MAAKRLRDLADLVDAVMEELKLQSTDTVSEDRIKRIINEVYIDEVVPFKRWPWTLGNASVTHGAYYGSGTASVTPSSTTVTLSVPPSAGTGSRKGFKFAVDNYEEIYTISAHTAGSATVTLSATYKGAVNTTASFKIWTEEIDLPTDCSEVIELWHENNRRTLEGRGLQEIRKMSAAKPKAEGYAAYFAPYDHYDPTPEDGEEESDRYRKLKIYPAINQFETTFHFDYVREVEALDLDGDEPIIPIEHRVVLKYGALARAWRSIARNPEEAETNRMLYEAKLARMAGKVEEGFDKPQLAPDSLYLSAKRGPRIKGTSRGSSVSGGGSSYTAPNYILNATIEGGNITANVTAAAGITVDGRDIGADGALLDAAIIDIAADEAALAAHIADTAEHGATGAVVGTTNTQTLTNKTLTSPVINSPTGIVKGDVGLGSVDNTSDATKNAAVATLTNKTLTSPVINTPTGIVKGDVGLGNVDNTSDATKNAAAVSLTNKTIDADLNTLSNIANAQIKAAAAIAVNKLAAVTADRAVVSDGSGFISPSAVTATELGYVSGVTSAIQTQLNALSNGVTDVTAVKVANYTILSTDEVVRGSTASGAITFTFPDATTNDGKVYDILKTNYEDSLLTIAAAGSDTLTMWGGTQATTTMVSWGERTRWVAEGSTWVLLERHIPSREGNISLIRSIAIRGTSNESVFTNSTLTHARYWREGNHFCGHLRIDFSGAPGTGTGSIGVRIDSFNYDTTNRSASNIWNVGNATFNDVSSGNSYSCIAYVANSGANLYFQAALVDGAGNNTAVNASNPVAVASGDSLEFNFRFPIADFVV